jgi:hypothetical protein
MKLVQGLILHETADGTIAVATGEAAKALNGMIRFSETAAFIVRALEHETTEDEVVAALTAQYRVDATQARADVHALITRLDGAGLITHGGD